MISHLILIHLNTESQQLFKSTIERHLTGRSSGNDVNGIYIYVQGRIAMEILLAMFAFIFLALC